MAQDDLRPLMDAHFSEMTSFPLKYRLNPNVQMFAQCEKAGRYFGIVARDGGEPVGYTGTFISPHRFNTDVLFASVDMTYVVPRYRGSLLAWRLMKATIAEARRRGACVLGWSAKPGSTLYRMLERLGNIPEETLFLQEL